MVCRFSIFSWIYTKFRTIFTNIRYTVSQWFPRFYAYSQMFRVEQNSKFARSPYFSYFSCPLYAELICQLTFLSYNFNSVHCRNLFLPKKTMCCLHISYHKISCVKTTFCLSLYDLLLFFDRCRCAARTWGAQPDGY